jgi:hypothetical protein
MRMPSLQSPEIMTDSAVILGNARLEESRIRRLNLRLRPVALGVPVLLGVLVLLRLSWLNQRPSIKPADVHKEAVLRPPGKAENPSPGEEDKWTLEITLDKRTERPLYVSDREYFFRVTPFVEGMSIGDWDFKQGLTNGTSGSPKGGSGFSMGNDGRHIPMVVQALVSKGVNVGVNAVRQITAFGYEGDRFPAQVRYYLLGKAPISRGQRAFIVYSHYEKRWGRDVSWTTTFPVQVDN